MENEWDSIKQTIFDIKKKREETKRKRDGSYIENMLTEELSKSLAMEIDKSILAELMKFKK